LNFLLQEPDFLGKLLFEGIDLIPRVNNLVNLLLNLVILGLQLAGPIFNCPEFV
jgi:hypothetical protein